MNIKKVIPTTIFVFLLATFFIGLIGYKDKGVNAATTCPYTDPEACLNYYNQQLNNLQSQKGNIQDQLNAEAYKQLSLEEKIKYINNQITQTENAIKTLEIEIAAHNVEIKLIEEDIQSKEDNISILKQEITILEKTVNERISESYKYSFLSPIDLLLNSKSLSNILRKTKYLVVTRAQDISSLEDYSQKITALKKEEEELAQQETNLKNTKEQIEEEKLALNTENDSLIAQKAEKDTLLKESQAKEAEYIAALRNISSRISDTETERQKVIIELFNAGQLGDGVAVNRGDPIGVDGHTGCAFGTHLHFAAMRNGSYTDPLPLLNNGTLGYPMKSITITQYYSSSHRAIDMVSRGSGNQSWANTYTVVYGICSIVDGILNDRKAEGYSNWNQANMIGEGAVVYAATAGRVYYYIEDTNGDHIKSSTDDRDGKYALVVSSDGSIKTFYVHLKF